MAIGGCWQKYDVIWEGKPLIFTREPTTITISGDGQMPRYDTVPCVEFEIDSITKPTKLWRETLKLRWLFLKFRIKLLILRVKYLIGTYDIEE